MLSLAILLLFLALVAAGMPVFAAMGLSAFAGTLALGYSDAPILDMALTVSQAFGQFVLVAVPLYILVGTLMEESGLSEKLFAFARSWLGALKGGLGVATVAACAIFAAISGSSVATVATIGLVSFPALTRRGYQPEFSGALIAAGGTLGILIPPSIAMILYGVLTEQSISALFMAGAVPGVVLAVIMAVYSVLFSRVDREAAAIPWPERLRATRDAVWVILLPVAILASIYSGLATPTEVAALAVVYVLVVGVATSALSWPGIRRATIRAVRTTVMIFLLIGFGRTLTEFFTLAGLPQMAVETVTQLGLSPVAVVSLLVLLYLLLGMVLEAMSMMLVTVPILYPVAMTVGLDPLAFGVFVVLAIEAAQITPPVGINLYTLAGIGKVHLGRLSLHVVPYVAMLVFMMFLVAFLPSLATWLPGSMR